MNEEFYKKAPQLLGVKWVQNCLGIGRATIYRRLADGSMMPPIKIGSTNRWPKDYIKRVMERGFDRPGTYNWPPKGFCGGGEGAPAAP